LHPANVGIEFLARRFVGIVIDSAKANKEGDDRAQLGEEFAFSTPQALINE
jgi:hypothetical protein